MMANSRFYRLRFSVVRFLLALAIALVVTAPARSMTAYGAGIVRYIHSNQDSLTKPFMLSLTANGGVGDIVPNYCDNYRLDEFSLEKRLPEWQAVIQKASAGEVHTVLDFTVPAGIYDFSSHKLPLQSGGGFAINAYVSSHSCNLPPYQDLPFVPNLVVYDVPTGIVPTSIGVPEDVAREIVDSSRALNVKIGAVVTNSFLNSNLNRYDASIRPLWVEITGVGHVVYKTHFK